MARLLKREDVLERVIDRFTNAAFAQSELVELRQQTLFQALLHCSDELHALGEKRSGGATSPLSLLRLLTICLTKPGIIVQSATIPSGNRNVQQLATAAHDQIQFETVKPIYAAFL